MFPFSLLRQCLTVYFTLTWVHCAAQAMIVGVLRLARLRHHGVATVSVLYLPLSTAVVWLLEVSPTFGGQLTYGDLPLLLFLFFQKFKWISQFLCWFVTLFCYFKLVWLLSYNSQFEKTQWKGCKFILSLVQVHRCFLSSLCSHPYFLWVLFHEQTGGLSVCSSWPLVKSGSFHLIHLQKKDITSLILSSWTENGKDDRRETPSVICPLMGSMQIAFPVVTWFWCCLSCFFWFFLILGSSSHKQLEIQVGRATSC